MKHILYSDVKIYYNFKLLFPNYRAIMLFGNIFYRGGSNELNNYLKSKYGKIFINHEKIHIAQARSFKCKYLQFYPIYLGYWIKNLFKYGFNKKAYKNIPFEREAYLNEKNHEYLNNGIHWKDYIY